MTSSWEFSTLTVTFIVYDKACHRTSLDSIPQQKMFWGFLFLLHTWLMRGPSISYSHFLENGCLLVLYDVQLYKGSKSTEIFQCVLQSLSSVTTLESTCSFFLHRSLLHLIVLLHHYRVCNHLKPGRRLHIIPLVHVQYYRETWEAPWPPSPGLDTRLCSEPEHFGRLTTAWHTSENRQQKKL